MCQSGRLYHCARCHCQVIICSHCDRGNIYCAGQCAILTRKEKKAKNQETYQQSLKGRDAHARRQGHYRQRQKEKVTHQSSQMLVQYDELFTAQIMPTNTNSRRLFDEKAVSAHQPRTVKQDIVTVNATLTAKSDYYCHFCGCRCSEKLRWATLYRQNRHTALAQQGLDRFPKPTG